MLFVIWKMNKQRKIEGVGPNLESGVGLGIDLENEDELDWDNAFTALYREDEVVNSEVERMGPLLVNIVGSRFDETVV